MTTYKQKEVGKAQTRKHTKHLQNITFEVDSMTKQAKTLTAEELRRVLDYVATRKHSTRNRALVLTSVYSGCRVGELSSLTYADVVDNEGKVRDEIRLKAENTKTNEARIVFVNAKLKKELQQYADTYTPVSTQLKFFYSQKRNSNGYNANTLTQFFHYLYKKAGVFGASSHSGRRTFITNLASKGVGVRVLMALAGHKSIATTQRYIELNPTVMKAAVELI
jgi:integrase/recombinase XerD